MKGSFLRINNDNNINFAGKGWNARLAKIITGMTKADALAPVVALEATVTGGRTIQAYKRGGKEEARERAIEETTGAIVWLWGVKVLNEIGDSILSKYLTGKKGVNFDVGTDKVLRKPFDNFMKNPNIKKNISQNKVAALKGIKVLSSILIANIFVGFIVPKVNHYITNVIRHEEHEKKLLEEKQTALNNSDKNQTSDNITANEVEQNVNNTSFKGGGAAMNAFTNMIENTNTGKLLSTDLGIAGGRMANARTKEERNEIAFRDLGSIYFYMWARGHVSNLLNLAESGRATRLNPSTAIQLDKHLKDFLEKNGGEMSAEEFKKLVLGKNPEEIKLDERITFEEGKLSLFEKFMNKFRKNKIEPLKVAKVSQLEQIYKDDAELLTRIRKMSKLQPEILDEAVITSQQIKDAINKSALNDAEFLGKIFKEYTDGASTSDYKYVSNKKLYRLKSKAADYVSDICKATKNGKVDKSLLDKMKNKNIRYNGLNFVVGFVIAATFLSTLLPKMQYYITRKKTGLNVFPGTYDYVHHKEMDA